MVSTNTWTAGVKKYMCDIAVFSLCHWQPMICCWYLLFVWPQVLPSFFFSGDRGDDPWCAKSGSIPSHSGQQCPGGILCSAVQPRGYRTPKHTHTRTRRTIHVVTGSPCGKCTIYIMTEIRYLYISILLVQASTTFIATSKGYIMIGSCLHPVHEIAWLMMGSRQSTIYIASLLHFFHYLFASSSTML